MKSVKDLNHIQRSEKTEITDKQQPREQNKKVLSIVVQPRCRDSAQHLERHASRTITKGRNPMCQAEWRATRALTQ